MTDDKYVVIKREDFRAFAEELRNKTPYDAAYAVSRLPELALDDAVVIRTRDSFASAALHTYANSIGVAAKAIGELAPSTRDRLLRIADYFYVRAVEADDTVSKLPD